MDYPVWDLAIGGGVLMAVVAIAHVVVSHFAIGGGLLIAVTETLAVRRGDFQLRELARRSSLVLILVATVFGAVSGVGIWVVAGLISPSAISALIRNYVWGWAIEWTFFVVELAAALLYFATWNRVKKRTHLALIWIYFVAAYLSLVVINGIVTFMLTPGRWLETRAFWDGFFNPTYWPSLVLRTGICVLMATVFMVFAALRAPAPERPALMRYLGLWLLAGVGISFFGYLWWEGALPGTVAYLFAGLEPGLPALAATRSFLLWALAATLVLGLVFLVAFPRASRLLPAVALLVTAVAFFGGYERLREGSRKPFLIHDYMFSNGLLVADVPRLNEEGVLARARWASFEATRSGVTPEARGRAVYLAECASCHPLRGYQGMLARLPEDPELVYPVLELLREQGESFAPGVPVDKASLVYPYMPPFVGTYDELEDLWAYLVSLAAPRDADPAAERVASKGAVP